MKKYELNPGAKRKMELMDKTIRRVTSFEDQQAETYRYWQSRSVGERFAAVWDATRDAYAFKGVGVSEREQGSSRTLVRFERS